MLATLGRRISCRERSEPLTHVRRKFSANCFDLRLTVESDTDGWKTQVFQENDGRPLHAAYRRNMVNAKLAAAEFAVARMTGGLDTDTVDTMAEHLTWAESW